jgi:hypothetical protein
MIPTLGTLCRLGIFSLLLAACSEKKADAPENVLPPVTSFPTTILAADSIERGLGSKDKSFTYAVEIDTSLYPNKLKFQLTKVKRYVRPGLIDRMEYTIEYFATSDDSVRTIVHEWNVANESNLRLNNDSENSDSMLSFIIRSFDSKFIGLYSTFTALFGTPTVRDIKSDFFVETNRDDVKWSGGQLKAYLLMFKRDKDIYRQIRLIVYTR